MGPKGRVCNAITILKPPWGAQVPLWLSWHG